jgi:hypothetical protein
MGVPCSSRSTGTRIYSSELDLSKGVDENMCGPNLESPHVPTLLTNVIDEFLNRWKRSRTLTQP